MVMKALRIIQETLQASKRHLEEEYWSEYRIAKRLGVGQSSYKYLRDKAQGMRLDLFIKSIDLAKEAGISQSRFIQLIREEVESAPVNKRGRKAEE
jgi:hypothetical protein